MAFEMLSVDWRQKPNARERIMFFAVLAVGCLGFFRACWSPSNETIRELRGEIEKVNQEKKVAAQLGPAQTPSPAAPMLAKTGTMDGIGSLRDVRQATDAIAQPLLLKGVLLTGLNAAELEREGNIVRQKVELNLVGSFYAVAEYLDAVEHMPAPLIIEDFSMTSNDDKSGRVTTTIKGSFYGMDK